MSDWLYAVMSHATGASYGVDGLGSGFDSTPPAVAGGIGGRPLFFGSGLGFGGPFGLPLDFFATTGADSTSSGIANSSSTSAGTSSAGAFPQLRAFHHSAAPPPPPVARHLHVPA